MSHFLGVIMSKIIFFFAGTGDTAENYKEAKNDSRSSRFEEDVIRIYINGCQAAEVGNGFVFPNLDIAANNIRDAFNGNQLDLTKLKDNFGAALGKIDGVSNPHQTVTIDELALEGFSRGAVTTFSVAKKLDELNIPIHIFANQPVPGEADFYKPLYSKYCDLTQCKNIRSAYTFLASYHRENHPIQNYFFRQMVAKFAPDVQAKEILFPHQQHLEWFSNSPINLHINQLMAEKGFKKPDDEAKKIAQWYNKNPNHYFTPPEFMQTIYGAHTPINKDPLFLKQLMDKAGIYLSEAGFIDTNTLLTPEKAAAIIAIHQVNTEHKNTFYELVLKETKQANQFVNIINKVTDVCHYLSRVTQDRTNKSEKIVENSNNYKNTVFLETYQFLKHDKPKKQDQKAFADVIYQAEKTFRGTALGIERGNMRLILKILTNFITHITGIALIVNSIHKAQTGNWLLFNHNRSENAVRDTRETCLKLMPPA